MPKAIPTTVVLRPDFERAILSTSEIETFLTELVGEGADLAKKSAAYRTGHLAGGIEGQVLIPQDRDAAGRFKPGAGYVGRVVAADFKALWLEYGTKNTRAQPFLIPTLEALVPGSTITRR